MSEQDYNYRALFKVKGEDWIELTPSTGVSKVYTRPQDAKALIRAQGNHIYQRNRFGGWDSVPAEIEYKIQRRPVGEWEDYE